MELGTSMGSGAVACPVCTLYLREGISLQKHLDTHPKEQVIEALIKASASGTPQPQVLASPPQAQNTIQTPPNPVASQSPYPVGPVFECPPVASMMSPQFASFSYQQFVNNGTMMIPQYAMAPQANQMMQMLYNPYGMYQQQQIPAVQMISPVSNVTTGQRSRPMVSVAGEVNSRSSLVPSLSGAEEPKHILPEIEAEVDTEEVLPDIEMSIGSIQLVQETNTANEQRETEEQSEHQTQQESAPDAQEEGGRMEYENIAEKVSGNRSTTVVVEDKTEVESILPNNDEPEAQSQAPIVPIQHEHTQTQNRDEFAQGFVANNAKEREGLIEVEAEEDGEREKEDQERTTPDVVIVERPKVSNEQPEEEQLERLLNTIMESGFNVSRLRSGEKKMEEDEDNREEIIEGSVIGDRETSVIQEISTEMQRSSPKIFEPTERRGSLDNRDDAEDSKSAELEAENQFLYRYKLSSSAPASPAAQKQLNRQRTYSMRSEIGSTENLSYPVGFEATTLLDDEEDESNEKRGNYDNFDEEDMEIEEITSPHTPFTKNSENTDMVRSHTPLSTISGISGLRVRTDLSKPCSPVSAHSFHHMDTNSLCAEDDVEDLVDPETEKDPIDCSHLQREAELMESLKNISQKLQPNHVYHQSVITENLASFSIGHHSQKPATTIHENYEMTNSSQHADNLLDLSEPSEPTTSTDSKNFVSVKSILQKPTTELLNINEDAHPGPMNVLEFDGLQILVPSTFISESSQKAVSATSRQSMASSEGGAEADEEIKSVNMRADEIMPPRGELSEQESNGCHESSAWQVGIDICRKCIKMIDFICFSKPFHAS